MNEFIPSEFFLSQNYPNPFSEKTIIKYCVAYKTRVQLTVYNSEGEVTEKLIDEEKKPGTYEAIFSAEGGLASGEYLLRLVAGNYSNEKRMILKNESL